MIHESKAEIKKRVNEEAAAIASKGQDDIKRLIDDAFDKFAGCDWAEAISSLQQADNIIETGRKQEHDFQEESIGFEKSVKERKKESEKSRRGHERYDNLIKAKKLTIGQLIELVDYLGAEREQSDYLDRLLSTKRLVHKRKGYRILRFRGVDGKGFIKLEGFEHVQLLEQEMNKGWIPIDVVAIDRILSEETAKAVKKIEERLPESPNEIMELINLLRDSKTPPEMIKKKITETKPTIRVGEHGVRVNYYMEKDGQPLIHFEGFPSKVWIRLDRKAIEKAVPVSHLFTELNEKLERIRPFNIESLAKAVSADKKAVKRITEFSKEFTKDDIDALLFLKSKDVIVV